MDFANFYFPIMFGIFIISCIIALQDKPSEKNKNTKDKDKRLGGKQQEKLAGTVQKEPVSMSDPDPFPIGDLQAFQARNKKIGSVDPSFFFQQIAKRPKKCNMAVILHGVLHMMYHIGYKRMLESDKRCYKLTKRLVSGDVEWEIYLGKYEVYFSQADLENICLEVEKLWEDDFSRYSIAGEDLFTILKIAFKDICLITFTPEYSCGQDSMIGLTYIRPLSIWDCERRWRQYIEINQRHSICA